jgi:hypothetical protein
MPLLAAAVWPPSTRDAQWCDWRANAVLLVQTSGAGAAWRVHMSSSDRSSCTCSGAGVRGVRLLSAVFQTMVMWSVKVTLQRDAALQRQSSLIVRGNGRCSGQRALPAALRCMHTVACRRRLISVCGLACHPAHVPTSTICINDATTYHVRTIVAERPSCLPTRVTLYVHVLQLRANACTYRYATWHAQGHTEQRRTQTATCT